MCVHIPTHSHMLLSLPVQTKPCPPKPAIYLFFSRCAASVASLLLREKASSPALDQ